MIPPSTNNLPNIAVTSLQDALSSLQTNPDTGLTKAEIETRRKQYGYNEVPEHKGHPALAFLGKFWGVSAWMLELIMALSAILGKYTDLFVVGALLIINAVLGFEQERRAAGRSPRACCARRAGSLSQPGNWSPVTSSACAWATSCPQTSDSFPVA